MSRPFALRGAMIEEQDDLRPWEPEGRRLTVGTRVRVRLSQECRIGGYLRQYETARVLRELGQGHIPETDGAVGRIIEKPPYVIVGPSHPYCVLFDEPVQTQGSGKLRGGNFAGAELEILDG